MDYFINHGKNTPKDDIAKKKPLWIDSETLCNDKNLVVLAVSTLKTSFLASNLAGSGDMH